MVEVGGKDYGRDRNGAGEWSSPSLVDPGDALETGGAEEVFMVKRGHDPVQLCAEVAQVSVGKERGEVELITRKEVGVDLAELGSVKLGADEMSSVVHLGVGGE